MIRDLLRGLSLKPVSYYKVYKEIAGSTVAGVMLSQLVYWFSATNRDTIWKVDDDWIEELDLSDGEIRGGKAKLKALDFLTIDMRGVPAKTHYTIDWDLLSIAVENGILSMDKKREERQRKKAEKAEKRASESQDCTVPLNQPNKVVGSSKASSGNSADLVPLNSRNKVGKNNGTLYKKENTEENTHRDNSENLHCRCDVSVQKVVEHLNSILNANYKNNNEHTMKLIKKGWTAEQLISVINKKYDDWYDTDSEQYLRPSTLFGEKFEEYLNSKSKKQRVKDFKIVKNIIYNLDICKDYIKNKNLKIKEFKNLRNANGFYFKNDELELLKTIPSTSKLLSLLFTEELEAELLKNLKHLKVA